MLRGSAATRLQDNAWYRLCRCCKIKFMTRDPVVTYVLVNQLGGITSMLTNLVKYRQADAMAQEAVMLSIRDKPHTPVENPFPDDVPVTHFSFSSKENWYHVFRRLSKHAGSRPGVLVANDVYEMLMLQAFRVDKKVVQIVHDAYNVQLAVLYGEVVDKFICHSRFYYEVLCQLLGRPDDIVHIPYGIPLRHERREPPAENQPLRLLFLGRHHSQKGVHDLIRIHRLLQERNIPVQWTIMGRGPETDLLHQQWKGVAGVRFYSPETNEEVLQALPRHDVMVFPTRFEGFPVSLLECMSAGLVPVASNLPGGLRELVLPGENGFLCPPGDADAFADMISRLHFDRAELEKLSLQAFDAVNRCYNAGIQSPVYQQFFSAVASSNEQPRHHRVRRKIGSRLDQRWLPNTVTRILRKDIR